MDLKTLDKSLGELRNPNGLRDLVNLASVDVSPTKALAQWIQAKEIIIMELGTMAMLESGCSPSDWEKAKGAVKQSAHRMYLSIVDNKLMAAQLSLQDGVSRRNMAIAAESVKVGQQNAKIAEDGAKSARLGAFAAGLSAVIAMVAILLQVTGASEEREVSVTLDSPLALEPVAIKGEFLEPLVAALEAAETARLKSVTSDDAVAPEGQGKQETGGEVPEVADQLVNQ